MLKLMICLSAFLMVSSVASYANENENTLKSKELATEILKDSIAANEQTPEEIASDVLTEITQTLVGCPNCPRNPRG